MTVTIFSLDNELYRAYIFYTSILIFKIFYVVFLIAKERHTKHVFISSEDAATHPKGVVKTDDPDVERVRRAHANDLENIPLFAIIALFYISIGPSYTVAINLLRLYTLARIFHTIAYVHTIPQPARGVSFGVGLLIKIYMTVQVIISSM